MNYFRSITVPSWATSTGTIGLAFIAWRSMTRKYKPRISVLPTTFYTNDWSS